MPLKIRVDDSPYQEQQVTLNGVTFYITFSFSSAYTRDNWIIDVFDSDKNNLLVGKRITSQTNLTYHSLNLTEKLGGWLFCVNTTGTRVPMNRDNFGTELPYQIWYYSEEEVNSDSIT